MIRDRHKMRRGEYKNSEPKDAVWHNVHVSGNSVAGRVVAVYAVPVWFWLLLLCGSCSTGPIGVIWILIERSVFAGATAAVAFI